jgi:hypothetical protein
MALSSSAASVGDPIDFKTFLETEYSQTILYRQVNFDMFEPYKPTIYFYLYRILKNVFNGFDRSNPVPVTLTYSFFYNLTYDLFQELREDEELREEELREEELREDEESIATKRLYQIYKNKDAFNGFEEEGDWDYLYQLKDIVLFVLYNDENYKTEIESNPLKIPEDFLKLNFGISLCSYHSSLEIKKVKKVEEIGEENFEISGQHYMMSPLGKKCFTFSDNNYQKDALNFIFLNGKNPLTKKSKTILRTRYKLTLQTHANELNKVADTVDFNLDDLDSESLSQKELKDFIVGKNRAQAKSFTIHGKKSNQAYKEVTKSVALSKDYFGSHK